MENNTTEQVEELSEVPVRPNLVRPGYHQVFKKHGLYDGKLFSARDKVTYTFIAAQEVVSLHFDKTRKAIFYKGHSVSNSNLTDEQVGHLEMFRKELEKNPEGHAFVKQYNEALDIFLKLRDTG